MRIPLATDLQNRNSTTDKDARLLNCFADDGRAVKRPGLDHAYSVSAGHATAPLDIVGQALFSWSTPAGVSTLAAIRGDTLNNAPTPA
jgi:hypothetical protein